MPTIFGLRTAKILSFLPSLLILMAYLMPYEWKKTESSICEKRKLISVSLWSYINVYTNLQRCHIGWHQELFHIHTDKKKL